MRVYNNTNSQLDLPLSGIQRITIPAKSVSGDIMPSTEFLSLLVSSYDINEIALIIAGPFELNLCANVTGSTGYVVQSLDEAIERFSVKIKEENIKEEENKEESSLDCDSSCNNEENCCCTSCNSDIEENSNIISDKKKKTKKN